MNNNNNFLLKIHMEEEGRIKEIFINKEGRSFTFIDDECVSDLVIPEFKLASLNMILKNVNEENGNDFYYAEYEKDNILIKEYDTEKIQLLINIITSISINDFIEYQENMKINDYYVDDVIDFYDCVLPIEMKKLISYTTNGVVLGGSDKFYLLPHNSIVNYNKEINNFIPFMLKNDTNYIGFDYKESSYKEYLNNKKINESKTLKGLLITSNIEILDLDADYNISNENKNNDDFTKELRAKIDKHLEEEKIDIHYNNTIKNIENQLARLNVGLILKPKKQEYQYKTKNSDEKIKIKNEIVEEIRKSIEQLEKIENANEQTKKILIKKNTIKDKNKKEKQEKEQKIIKTPKIKSSQVQNERLIAFLEEYDNQQNINESLKQEKNINIKDNEIKIETKPETTELLQLNDLILKSISNGNNNYKINFNDTQKLVVEHLPYYEFNNEFGVIQIPEIEVDKITLLPNGEIDFGKIKLVVYDLNEDKVDLLVQSATSIVDKDNKKIKNGTHIELNLNTEMTLRLNKQGVMETWTFKLEKSTFEKELRNIDYKKIMNYIVTLEGYKKLGNIEKYELQKSIMLFIDFVMKYSETKELDELYNILIKEPTLYEEYITKYNIKHAQELKDSLSAYENKKEYIAKLNYVNGLINAKWLDYPRYIFSSHNYFQKDDFLQEFIEELNSSIKEEDFADYLNKLFKEYEMFIKLDDEGKENLNKCLEYLSVLYKYNPYLGENYKYQIEKSFMIGATEEDISLLISKLCRRGIKDYSSFVEYDVMMKEKYRQGKLIYPIFSESFGIEEIRNGGEYDEY